jgi:phage terminase small subunit
MTPKQEAFCLAYVETGNASEAYRRAYDAENMSAEAVAVEASKLLKRPNVALRVAELQAAHVERHKFTVDDMIAQLDEDRKFARELETPAAAITASMGKAKLLGFLTDKVEHTVGKDLAEWLGQR